MTTFDLALIGFGGVNRALAELIRDEPQRFASLGFELHVVAITDLAFGSLVQGEDIDLADVLTMPRGSSFAGLPGGSRDPRNEDVIKNSPADVVVEATFTSPVDGEPAVSHVRWALEAGKHVVPTNKGPVALYGPELTALAGANGVGFEYEGSVMSGTPVLRLARKMPEGLELSSVQGILNGTSNFVLGRMEAGLRLDEAIAEAQDLGYAEADPTADIGGSDVRLKVAILANELLGADLRPDEIATIGIQDISSDDVAQARAQGLRWKLIGEAQRDENGRISAAVRPSLFQPTIPWRASQGPPTPCPSARTCSGWSPCPVPVQGAWRRLTRSFPTSSPLTSSSVEASVSEATPTATAAESATAGELVVHDEFDGTVLARLPQCTEADVQVELLRAATAAPAAAAMPRHERGRTLDTAAQLLEQRATEVAELIVAEAGKTIRHARKEVSRAVNTLKLSAAETRRNVGEVVPFDSIAGSENRQGWFTREPLGALAAITPYNDALNLVAHKRGPAIAGGNTVILKPSRDRQLPDPKVERGPGHPEVADDLGGRLPTVNEPQGIADLGVGEGLAPPAEVLASGPAFGHRAGDPLPFALQLHLGQHRHDGEDHQAHRSVRVDVSPTEMEHPQVGAPCPQASAKASMFCVDRPSRSSVAMTSVSLTSTAATALLNPDR